MHLRLSTATLTAAALLAVSAFNVVLCEDYFSVPEERIMHIESVLTVVGCRVVYAADPSDALGEGLMPPQLPPVSPPWSPVAHFGGYQQSEQ